MNLNKKLDRFKQWTNERLGAESNKTTTSEEFQTLEAEMALRHEGMERLHKSMNTYVKYLSKQSGFEDKEKVTPTSYLGTTMIRHGEDFDQDSLFGQCLIGLGGANESISRAQESYVDSVTSSWLETLERSLAQMKEYQAARKKLDQRRLAYDASLTKIRNAKKEDYRVEEELRSQKAKFEESSEDVLRRMQDIQDAEADGVTTLSTFMDAELEYHEKCREVLLQTKRDWRASNISVDIRGDRPSVRSRANTAHSFTSHQTEVARGLLAPDPEDLRARRPGRAVSASSSPQRNPQGLDAPASRPILNRVTTFEGPPRLNRNNPGDLSPVSRPKMSRLPTDSIVRQLNKTQPRTTRTLIRAADSNPSHEAVPSNPDRYLEEEEVSIFRATSYGSMPSGIADRSITGEIGSNGRTIAPPPVPARSKKPPPPPPMRRSALSASQPL